MLRRSPFRWLVLAGIMLFFAGSLLDITLSQKGILHLVLGIAVNEFHQTGSPNEKDSLPGQLGFDVQLDSLQLSDYEPKYELQVRETDQGFSKQIHTSILPPAHLVTAFPLSQMKIRKIADTEYRFRLKQFYPDFAFQYTYPENQDTIPPRAPGITLNLVTPGKEEVVTLRSDKPNLRKLEDVVGFGCTLEFYWTMARDTLNRINPDSGKSQNKIVFVGKDKKVFLFLDDGSDSLSLEYNRFYAIPGKDSIGFTILQSFPDARLLKAEPISKSGKLLNPVAEAEVWKLGGGSQNVYLYPNAGGRHGGEWRVPGTDLVLTCALSHEELVNAAKCMLSITDSLHQVKMSKMANASQVLSYGGKKLTLSECDPGGIWANFKVWTEPGYNFRLTGIVMALAAFLGILLQGLKKRQPVLRS